MVRIKRLLLLPFSMFLLAGTLGVASASAAPAIDKVHTGRATAFTTNWSGYAAYDSIFSHVKGDWTVPSVNCSSMKGQQLAITTAFVGIDGYNSNTVEQSGTDSDCIGKNASYVAWYEFYPQRAFFLDQNTYPVSPGNQMHAEATVSGGQVTLTLQNTSSGSNRPWTYSPAPSIPSSGLQLSSAEWIVESPASKLAPFISVPFSNAGARSGGGSDQPISAFTNDAITMVSKNGRTIRTHPSPASGATTSFSVIFDNP